MSKEIKRAVRRRRNTLAWITTEADPKARQCQVINVSDGGTQLLLDPTTAVTSPFQLTKIPRSKVKENCEIVWQTGRTVGVKFAR